MGEGKTKGVIFDNLFGMFTYFLKNTIFDFISNIMANVSALKEGREHVISSNILPKLLDIIRYEKVNSHRRKYLIETVRNTAFEYEASEAYFRQIGLIK